ncbi:unnamed protein product [Camellia sinensis]
MLSYVSDNLLHDASSSQETLIFCSQTLRSKVQRDFEELPSEAFRPLRDLLNLIENISQRPPLKLEPSLAVAALAVHVPAKDWGDGGIVNWLRDEMNSHPECIPSFLELLRVLPEMIPASTLASHPLVLTALSSLNSDILLEASVNAENMEAMPEIEWNGFNTGMYCSEEADFMAQLLGNCSLPNELPGISSFGVPSESAMNFSVMYSSSDNSINPNVHSLSQESSYNYQYQELSDHSHQFLAMNDSSMSIDFYTGEDRNTGSPVEVYTDNLMEGDDEIIREPEMAAVPETSSEEKSDSLQPENSSKKRSRVSGDVQRKRNVKSRKNQKVVSGNNNNEDNNNNGGGINNQASSSCCSEDAQYSNGSQEQQNGGMTTSSSSKGAAATLNLNGKSRASRRSATDPQSLYARKRRERINERLKILQNLSEGVGGRAFGQPPSLTLQDGWWPSIVDQGVFPWKSITSFTWGEFNNKVDISTMLEEAVQYVKFLQLQIKLLSSDDLWMYAPIAYNGMDNGLDLKIPSPR